jgi:hypothetical protein
MNASYSLSNGTFIVCLVVDAIVQVTLSDIDRDRHAVFDSHKNVIPLMAFLT